MGRSVRKKSLHEGTGWLVAAVAVVLLGPAAGCAPEAGDAVPPAAESTAPSAAAVDPLDRLPDDRAGEVVRRAIEAAGGWDQWAAKGTVDYTKRTVHQDEGEGDRESADRHRYRLHPSPAMRIDWDDAEGRDAVLINDGDEAWKVVDGEIATEPSDRDQAWNATFGSHYMFSLPFKLTDEGAHFTHEGQETLPDGRLADRIRVVYDPGVGSAGGMHTWTFFFTADRGDLAAYFLHFGEGTEDYRFTEYGPPEDIDGLTLPTRRTVWRSNAAMEKLALDSDIHHDAIRFGVDLPDELFRPPEEAAR